MAMIERPLTAQFQREILRQVLVPVLFVELQYDRDSNTDPVDQNYLRLHDWLGTIEWDGKEWHGVGNLGEIEELEETTEITNVSLQLVLSGVNQELVKAALDSDYYRRRVNIWLAVLDMSTGELKEEPTVSDPFWSGYMDVMSAQIADEDFVITLTAENEDADMERPTSTLYSNAQQQSDYPGDKGFELLLPAVDSTVTWPRQ